MKGTTEQYQSNARLIGVNAGRECVSAYSNVEWCTGQLEMQFPLATSLGGRAYIG